jgi:hypothetical protein
MYTARSLNLVLSLHLRMHLLLCNGLYSAEADILSSMSGDETNSMSDTNADGTPLDNITEVKLHFS